MKKKILVVSMVLILGIVYLFSGKVINKLYLRDYEKDKIQGRDRYETMVKCGEDYWKNPEKAILINTNEIGTAMSAVPYAYNNDMPILLTEKNKLPSEVYSFIKEKNIKEVYIMGGIKKISKVVERSINRAGIKTSRFIDESDIGMNILFSKKTIEKTKSNSIFLIFDGENGYPVGTIVLGKAAEKGIPILPTNESNIYEAVKFINDNKIDNVYIIGRNKDLNSTVDKLLPGAERISGKDKFEINRNFMKRFYDMNKVEKIYVTKGGTLKNGKELNIGEFVNGIAISPVLATENQPLLITDTSYFKKESKEFIDKYKIKEICTIGFEIEKTKLMLLNFEQSRILSACILIILIIIITFRALVV